MPSAATLFMKILNISLILLVLLSLSKRGLRAQELSGNNYSFGVQWHYGSFLTNEPKAQYIRDSYTYFGELSIRKQDRLLALYPQNWGVSLFFGHTGSLQYMGRMAGAYAFTHFPVWSRKKFRSSFRTGAGTAWVQKPYDKETNHKNVLIGTSLNYYLNLALLNEVKVTPDLFINAGLSFSHLSNGGSTLPNLGLNIPAFTAGIRYSRQEPYNAVKLSLPPRDEEVSFALYTSAGWKQAPWIGSKRYLINVLQAEVKKRNSFAHEFGGGAVFFYNRSLEVDPTTITSNKRQGNKVQAGVYASYEHHLGRLSVPLQLGAYVHNQDIYPAVFQQLGLRYEVSRHWSALMFLKTHTGKADFIHGGVGYRIK